MTTIHAFGRHIATYLGTDLHKAAVGESKWKDQEHFEQSLNISSTQRSIVITPSYCELDIVRMVVDMMRGDKTELFDIENEGSDYPYCIKHIAMWAANHLTIGDTDRSDIDAGTVDQIISWFLAFGNNAEKLRQVVKQTEAVHHAIEQIQWFSTYDKTILWTLVKSISAFGHQILEKITSQCAVWDEMMLHLRPDSLPKNLSHFVSRKYGGYPTDISLLQLYKDCLPYVNLVNISSSLSVFVMHMVQLFVSPKKHVPDHSDERTIEYSQQLILYGLTFHYISSLERICDGLHGLQEIELLYTDTVEGLVQAAIETSCDTTVPLPLLSPTAAGTGTSD